jgi:GDP-4-dehydro-6-deoxy-D-mannose reductase
LAADGHALHGTVRGAKPQAGAALPERLTCHSVDLRERSTVEALVQSLRPDWVFHLAASSSVAASWEDPAETLTNNIGAQANLLAALVGLERLPRVLVVGSADEYGAPQRDDALLDEDAPLRPITPYGVSKVAQDYLALQYHLSHGLPVVRVRPFNHVGPGQSPAFAVASFARQVARIEAGREAPVLKVGNLESRRDFSDVRDVVQAYRLAVDQGRPGDVYNIGSERSVRLREVVDMLVGMSRTRITVEVDPSRTRPVETRAYRCDSSRFRRLTGWRPSIPLEQTLRDTIEYWRRVEAA